ncbi:hypothetical protein JW905_10725 [bacterium]|nr:hypothetical protein [candidate division CSSED10-310 bacterium]
MAGRKLQWSRIPVVEKFIDQILAESGKKNLLLGQVDEQLLARTSTHLCDWLDHLLIPDSMRIRNRLGALGFAPEKDLHRTVFFHPEGRVPRIILTSADAAHHYGVAIRVESIECFLDALGCQGEIEGEPLGPYRSATIVSDSDVKLLVVERRGSRSVTPSAACKPDAQGFTKGRERWRACRNKPSVSFKTMHDAADALVNEYGTGPATAMVMAAERDYWCSRNRIASFQQERQAALGLGWVNHDHHTFRSSRSSFLDLQKLFLKLGFIHRERFYAGREAGWGAQVMEQHEAGIVLFLDVDLTPEEVCFNFTGLAMREQDSLGTIGLWCALHGDSLFGAGLHHVAANFDFDRLHLDMQDQGLGFMPPFSDLPYLRQSFSQGEEWQVSTKRLQQLLSEHRISASDAEHFAAHGARGSHLENIQRREGYKGFSQEHASTIIRDTDPRSHAGT